MSVEPKTGAIERAKSFENDVRMDCIPGIDCKEIFRKGAKVVFYVGDYHAIGNLVNALAYYGVTLRAEAFQRYVFRVDFSKRAPGFLSADYRESQPW